MVSDPLYELLMGPIALHVINLQTLILDITAIINAVT